MGRYCEMLAEMTGGELSERTKPHDAERRLLTFAVLVHFSTFENAARQKVSWILTAVRGSGKPMMKDPQLWKLRVIVLRCEERVHHTGSDRAPQRAASMLLRHGGPWPWRSIPEVWAHCLHRRQRSDSGARPPDRHHLRPKGDVQCFVRMDAAGKAFCATGSLCRPHKN